MLIIWCRLGQKSKKEGDVDIEAISASSLLFGVSEARNRLNIIVLDACRNNPYRSLFRSGSRGLTTMNAPTGSLIAFSTSPGNVAADGSGSNSPFTKALAKSIQMPGLTIERVFKAARRKVYNSSKKKQLPWINSSVLGDFYPAGQQRKRVRSEPVRSSDAAREWRSLQNGTDTEDLEAYITQFGKRFPYYGRKAKKRLRKLKESRVAVGVFPTQQPVERNRFTPGTIFDDCNGAGWCPSMVVVPKGSFMMGSKSGDKDERHIRRVTIGKPFAVGRFEVTWDEWDACVKDGGCDNGPVKKAGGDNGWGKGKRPVIEVSWNDAKTYLKWLKKKTGKPYRLLSEAEWEYVARAKGTGKYSWGNGIGRNKANCDGCGSKWDNKKTAPVGSFDANNFKVHDMHGNVWEWVEDCYKDSYKGAPDDGSAKTTGSCDNRVLRGGSWNFNPSDLRSAGRFRGWPDFRVSYGGFRVALSLPLARTR